MQTSAAGRAAIALREGNKLTAYQDSVGVWTIGVGHTAGAGEPHPRSGMTITAAQSDEILSRDLAKFEKAVNGAVSVALTQNQFDALVSLAFNIGGGAFAKSTLVRRLNKRDYAGAAAAFMMWNKAGGKALEGLTTRRDAERQQFLTPPKPDPLARYEAEKAQQEAQGLGPAPAPVQPTRAVPMPAPVAQRGFWSRLLSIFN